MKTTKRDMPHKGQACEQSHQAIATQAGLTPEPAGFDAAANADTGRAALPAGLDPELLNLYIAEALDHIDKAEGALLSIERDPGNAELLDTVFRAFHTIKGTSGMLELEPVQRLAHLAENLLDRARDHEVPLTGANADLAFASCDALKVMVKGLEGVGPGDPVPVPEGYASLLDRLGSQATAGSSAQADLDADKLLHGGNVSPEKDESGPAASLAEGTENTLRPQGACGHGSTDSAVRVSTERLDKLINMVGELVISHSVTTQDAGRAKGDAAGIERNVRRTAKIVRELQNLTLVLCMVSLKATFQRMARLVRDLGRRNGKPIRLVTEGEGTEIDRNMVESLGDPLVHMIRNAIDHGIESADERRKAGKDETGTLCLRARYSGGGRRHRVERRWEGTRP